MTTSRFRSVLFTVILTASALPLRGFGQDKPKEDGRNFAELLEMELSDVKQENAKLKLELEKLQKEKAKPVSGSKKDVKRLKKENGVLKDEIIKLDGEVKQAAKERETALADMKKLNDEVAELRSKLKDASSSKGDGKKGDNEVAKGGVTDSELIARCKNLEDENEILKREVDERKGIDEQRKSAFDNLFKELAEIKRKLKDGDATIVKLQAEIESGKESVRAKAGEVAAEKERTAKLQQVVDGHKSEVGKLKNTIAEVRAKVKSTEKQLKQELAARLDAETELSRIKLTDAQRKKAMDDVLTKLATSEDRNVKNDLKIKSLESRLSEVENQSKREQARLSSSLKIAEDEVTQLEQELAAATKAQKSLEKELKDGKAGAQRDTARIVELESELARMKATDAQRKKSMDKLLLEISELEAKQGSESGELAAVRKDAERAKTELKSLRDKLAAARKESGQAQSALADLRGELDDANKQLSRLKKSKRGGKGSGKLKAELESLQTELAQARQRIAELESAKPAKAEVNPDLKAELEKLHKENGELRTKIEELTQKLKVADEALAKDSSRGEDAEQLIEMERKSWEQSKTDLEQEIAHLNKLTTQQAKALGELKADLAESKKSQAELSKETERLRNRKIDVRSSDLYKEMEQMNVVLREKIVQIEAERQRLAKSVKKLEKRVDRFDEDMDHEKGLRQKAEQALADAKAREDEYKELIERLMARCPVLEKQVADLSDQLEKSSKVLVVKDGEIKALKIELDKRAHRLIKAERVAEILEKSRKEVLHASDREKLDMHYNMAAVYARDGKFEDAEREYLRALRINPMDADVHYNLGILYDDELKSPEKAKVHYRRYLKLNPHGADADQVRNWLMRLEMREKH